MTRQIITTTHHIVPKSRNGSNIRANKTELDERVHIALHRIFSNMTPVEQLDKLMKINSSALTEEFKNDVHRILNTGKMENDYVYRKGILVPKNKLYE